MLAPALALGRNDSWGDLEVLNLAYCTITDAGAAGLSLNKSWTKLLELNLCEIL